MIGDDLPTAQKIWHRIARRQFTDGDLPAFLLSMHKKWQPGTLAAEFARALLAESNSRELDPEPEALNLADVEHLPKTTRIDGILPLTIPVPGHAHWPADELLTEAARLRLMPAPEDHQRTRDELALAYLALLHRRPLNSTHRLAIMPHVACPQSATSRPGNTLVLLGELPLGGAVTLFFSSFLAEDRCSFAPSAAEHFDRLKLQRTSAGKLTLTEGAPRPHKPREKWTFRL